MAMEGWIPPYSSCLEQSDGRAAREAKGHLAHRWFCFTTTLERILREEVTTAAQVSSADDSKARTVK